jgi:peptidoglycan hydrolase-like protein with peptidoglycan-binding domain
MMRIATLSVLGFLLVPAFVSAASCIEITRTITLESTGPDVSRLQVFLRDNSQYTGAISGHVGSRTREAIGRWQLQNNLTTSSLDEGYGILGPKTRSAMSCLPRDLSVGTIGPDVMRLQRVLASLGFFAGEATGYFGAETEAALKEFQTARGIDPTGLAGPTSRSILVWIVPKLATSSTALPNF